MMYTIPVLGQLEGKKETINENMVWRVEYLHLQLSLWTFGKLFNKSSNLLNAFHGLGQSNMFYSLGLSRSGKWL